MNEQIASLLTSYQIAVTEIRNALRKAGLSEREIIQKTINLPEFKDMLPEDVENLYKDFKLKFIVYLNSVLRLSGREIERRLGGSSYVTVLELLKEVDKKNE